MLVMVVLLEVMQLVEIKDVFEPFVRLSKARSGHGLGLAIVQAIAELHNGGVTVANREEGGAIFTLRVGTRQPDNTEGVSF